MSAVTTEPQFNEYTGYERSLSLRPKTQCGRIFVGDVSYSCAFIKNYMPVKFSSREYKIDGIIFQIPVCPKFTDHTFYVNIVKVTDNNTLLNAVHVSSQMCGGRYLSFNETIKPEVGLHKVHTFEKQTYVDTLVFEIKLLVEAKNNPCGFAVLYDDTELTDFALEGKDGCVAVHRAVLGASSPVFRRMLAGEWKETKEGAIHVLGTSKETLEHFKTYMYLHIFPESCDFESLLSLASYYMMPGLEEKCAEKLVNGKNAANAMTLCEYAVKHNTQKVLLAVFEKFQAGWWKISDIPESLL